MYCKKYCLNLKEYINCGKKDDYVKNKFEMLLWRIEVFIEINKK